MLMRIMSMKWLPWANGHKTHYRMTLYKMKNYFIDSRGWPFYRLISKVYALNKFSTAIATFYAPHVGCPDPERVVFRHSLYACIHALAHAAPCIPSMVTGQSLVSGSYSRPPPRMPRGGGQNVPRPGSSGRRPQGPGRRAGTAASAATRGTCAPLLCAPPKKAVPAAP